MFNGDKLYYGYFIFFRYITEYSLSMRLLVGLNLAVIFISKLIRLKRESAHQYYALYKTHTILLSCRSLLVYV